MPSKSQVYCFRASYDIKLDKSTLPPWLAVDENWLGYRIQTLPWIVDVAKVLDLLVIDDSVEEWIFYLENLGLKEVTPVCCEDFFTDSLYC
ncbi:MAG: hypothetical protein Kow0049_32940 [Stanieria sp.]